MTNPFNNTRIEFHILQSFPVSCLNRDDVGAPKSAMIGGYSRARVSSQCWKRAIRMEMANLGINIGKRTRLVTAMVEKACKELGADDAQALACGEAMAKTLTKTVKPNSAGDYESDTLFYISHAEAEAMAKFFSENEFKPDTDLKELLKRIKTGINTQQDGLDIALFGRMAASAPEVNIEASASFAHAISTHVVASEVEFFTAVDDFVEQGSGHMGSLEYNSATYYRYISLDLGKLYENLVGPADLNTAIEAFVKAIYAAVPTARQTTMSAASPWDFARILLRKGHRIQASFEKPVDRENGLSILEASKVELKKQIDRFEQLSGSMYGKIAEYFFGDDTAFSIDKLIDSLKSDTAALLTTGQEA